MVIVRRACIVRVSLAAACAVMLCAGRLGGTDAGAATADPALPPRAIAYARRMATLPPAPKPVEVESLFTLAVEAANELSIPSKPQAASPVEAMDDSAADRARQMLPGISIIRSDEGNGAAPIDSFFLQLAHRRGTSADIAFFRLRAATADVQGAPIWVSMVTDYSGCTRFGSGDLVRAWKGWTEYKKGHPARYASTVGETLESIENELLRGDCVCGGKEDLVRELQLFIDGFPNDTLVTQVRTRMEAVRRGAVGIRYNCVPR